MKKFIYLLALFLALLMTPIIAFCSDGIGLSNVPDIEVYFVSLAALAAIVMPITNFIKNLINSSGAWTVGISWIVSVALSFIGWWLNLGMFEGITIIWVIIYGVAVGMISNSIFDVGIIQAILKALKSIFKKE